MGDILLNLSLLSCAVFIVLVGFNLIKSITMRKAEPLIADVYVVKSAVSWYFLTLSACGVVIGIYS